MFKNILVPLDGSDVAEVVLATTKGLAKALGARVSLIRVVDTSAITRTVMPASVDESLVVNDLSIINQTVEAELKEAKDYLARVATGFSADGIAVSTQVRQGVAGEEIIEAIEEEHIDVAMVATHGRSGIKRTIFGSVADHLIRESGKPVLVIKAT